MNDTTRRFLSEIVERLPAGRIVELRLFPAIRQSAMESGAAVVAVELAPRPPDAPTPDEQGAALPGDAREGLDAGTDDADAESNLALLAASEEAEDSPYRSSTPPVVDESGDDPGVAITSAPNVTRDGYDATDDGAASLAVAATDSLPNEDDDGPYRDTEGRGKREEGRDRDGSSVLSSYPTPSGSQSDSSVLSSYPTPSGSQSGLSVLSCYPTPSGSQSGLSVLSQSGLSVIRYAIFSARYRLTVKGAERGKWEVELRHEADAPLDTVERVARGVAKRAGDESDPEHFSGESLRHALEAPAWATTL